MTVCLCKVRVDEPGVYRVYIFGPEDFFPHYVTVTIEIPGDYWEFERVAWFARWTGSEWRYYNAEFYKMAQRRHALPTREDIPADAQVRARRRLDEPYEGMSHDEIASHPWLVDYLGITAATAEFAPEEPRAKE